MSVFLIFFLLPTKSTLRQQVQTSTAILHSTDVVHFIMLLFFLSISSVKRRIVVNPQGGTRGNLGPQPDLLLCVSVNLRRVDDLPPRLCSLVPCAASVAFSRGLPEGRGEQEGDRLGSFGTPRAFCRHARNVPP